MKRAVALAGLCFVIGSAGCLPQEDDSGPPPSRGPDIGSETLRPPCVTVYPSGSQISVQLGVAYNAASDYLWDGSLQQDYVSQETPSCAAIDGLDTGSTVFFLLAMQSKGFDEACKPYYADFQPESLSEIGNGYQPDIASNDEPFLSGVSIAASFAAGTIVGAQATVTRALFTPSMNPSGPLVARELPPLAFTREITWGDGGVCFDSWVATPEVSP